MRIRQIKPEFWKHEGLATVARDVRLLFVGLWNLADGWGILEDRPMRIRAELFPYDTDISPATFEGWLALLEQSGLIKRYRTGVHGLIFIPQFRKHQLHGMHKEEKKRPTKWALPEGADVAEIKPEGADDTESSDCHPPARVAVPRSPSRGAGHTGIRGKGVTAPPGSDSEDGQPTAGLPFQIKPTAALPDSDIERSHGGKQIISMMLETFARPNTTQMDVWRYFNVPMDVKGQPCEHEWRGVCKDQSPVEVALVFFSAHKGSLRLKSHYKKAKEDYEQPIGVLA